MGVRCLLFIAVVILLLPTNALSQVAAGTVRARLYDSGGTAFGTSGNPVRTDPTGSTTQPVSGTVTANAGTGVFDVTPASPVATDYLPARITDGTGFVAPLAEGTFTGRINTQGQKAMSASTPVVIASDQSAISTTPTGLTSIATFQQAVTATAAVLPTNTAKRVCIKVGIGSTQTVYFGPSTVTTANGQVLEPGDGWCGQLDNSNRVYVVASGTGSTIYGDILN